jgi:acetyltransferase-like isoleucine patch superfamily enzyme
MAYYTEQQLQDLNFKSLGKNVKISDKASIYNANQISIGHNSRIDDFCILSGSITIKSHCHITPMCLVAGGQPGVFLEDFCTLAYGVKIFAQSDDYSGKTMANSLVPRQYKSETFESVHLGRHVIVGAGSIVMPGVCIAEGCSVGAMSLVNKCTEPWGIYVGSPAKRLKNRSKELLLLEKQFLKEIE